MKNQNHNEFNNLPQEYQKEPVEFIMPEEQFHQAKSEFNEEAVEKEKPAKKRNIRSLLKYALGTVAAVAVVISASKQNSDLSPIVEDIPNEYVSVKIGGNIEFGRYEQDGNSENGFELIDWTILDEKDGNVLLYSTYILDGVPYSLEKDVVTWDNSYLRTWLNNDFLNVAFSEEEQQMILETFVQNDGGLENGILNDNDTYDKIFALSLDEIRNYFPTSAKQRALVTSSSNAKVENWTVNSFEDKKTYSGTYWLRTINEKNDRVLCVYGGYLVFGSDDLVCESSVTKNNIGVRPAIWVNCNMLGIRVEADDEQPSKVSNAYETDETVDNLDEETSNEPNDSNTTHEETNEIADNGEETTENEETADTETTEPLIEYDEFPMLEGEVTLLEELPFEGGSIETAYRNTLVVRDSDGVVGLYDISGNPINDIKYNDNISWSYTTENPYIVLRRTEVNREYADLYSADGTLEYSDLEDYFNGVLIYRDGPDVVAMGDDYYGSVYRFVDENTGETLYTFDEEEYLASNDSGRTLMAYCHGYKNSSVIMMSIFPTDATYDYIFVSRNNVLSARELLKDHGIEDITFFSGSYLHLATDKIYLRYYDSNYNSVSHIIIDTVTGELVDFKMPDDERFEAFNYSYNGTMAFYLDKQNWIAYQFSDECFVIADLEGNILIDDVSDIGNAGDYLLLSGNDGVRYYNPETSESILFDSITFFEGEYAFVVKDGMGYFVNRDFEPVSSSTPATRADIFSYSNIIYLEAQNKYYIFG